MARAIRIATAGFTLIRSRPRAVLAWGFVYLLFAGVVSLLTRPLIVRTMLAMPRPGTVVAEPVTVGWGVIGPVLIANLGMYGMMLILLAAAMRAVLKPEEPGAFFIRVGMDELRLLGTLVLLGLMVTGLYFAAILAMVTVVAVAALIVGGATTEAGHPAIFIVAAMLLIAIFVMLLVFQIRFMLALPLTLVRGRITIREAWTRSRGHFRSLFGGVMLGGVIVGGISLVASIPMFLLLLRDGNGLTSLADPARQAAMMGSRLLYPLWLLVPLLGGFFIAMTGGALAQALLETETAGLSQPAARRYP